ncbi:MAG: thioesterase family protein [Bacillota bacterium]
MADLQPGIKGSASTYCTDQNTAIAYGSGSIRVLATPAMIGLMEEAALKSVQPYLPPGQTTVGIKVDVQHLAATPPGMQVTATAELVEVDGRRLVFKVEARDEKDLVGQGVHERFIVQEEKFLSRAAAKLG